MSSRKQSLLVFTVLLASFHVISCGPAFKVKTAPTLTKNDSPTNKLVVDIAPQVSVDLTDGPAGRIGAADATIYVTGEGLSPRQIRVKLQASTTMMGQGIIESQANEPQMSWQARCATPDCASIEAIVGFRFPTETFALLLRAHRSGAPESRQIRIDSNRLGDFQLLQALPNGTVPPTSGTAPIPSGTPVIPGPTPDLLTPPPAPVTPIPGGEPTVPTVPTPDPQSPNIEFPPPDDGTGGDDGFPF